MIGYLVSNNMTKNKKIIVLLLLITILPSVSFAQASGELNKVFKKKAPMVDKIDFEKSEFESETRVGFSNATGNTKAISVIGSHHTKYRYKRFENNWRAGANYYRVFSSTTGSSIGTSSRFIYGTYRFDYYILDWFTWFIGGGGYTDRIKGVDVAGQGFTGFRFFVVRKPRTQLNLSFGYNYTSLDRLPPSLDKEINSLLGQLEFIQKIGSVITFEESLEALQDVLHGYDIRVNNETALKVKISDHFGIVISFNLRFDNRPAIGYKKLDTLTGVELAITF